MFLRIPMIESKKMDFPYYHSLSEGSYCVCTISENRGEHEEEYGPFDITIRTVIPRGGGICFTISIGFAVFTTGRFNESVSGGIKGKTTSFYSIPRSILKPGEAIRIRFRGRGEVYASFSK